jgi:hypothetical protein
MKMVVVRLYKYFECLKFGVSKVCFSPADYADSFQRKSVLPVPDFCYSGGYGRIYFQPQLF